MSSLIAVFHKDVQYETNAFSLADDLDCLDRLRGQNAPVAVVLYAARILEALVFRALKEARLDERDRNGQDPKHHEAIHRLKNYGGIAKETGWLLDRLREIGNRARHLGRKITPDDADQAYALALRALHWYFREFPDGPKLPALTVNHQPFDSLLPAGPAEILRLLQSEDLGRDGFVSLLRLHERHCPLLVSPVLAAVMVEKLLDRKRPAEAQAVLTEALARMPDDVRLRQLQGLLWSRGNQLADAIRLLEAIGPTDTAADEETAGILAGAYKRRADADQAGHDEWLKRSHDGYARGWRLSEGKNPYLGINAAATALWLSQPDYEEVAREVRDLLTERKRVLSPRPLSLWDALALAEAQLLLGEWDAAREGYREAAECHKESAGPLEVAGRQADRDLKALGRGGPGGDDAREVIGAGTR